jgi:hypothetical protein
MYRQLDQRISDKEVCHFLVVFQCLLAVSGFSSYLFLLSHFIRGQALALLIECISTRTVAYLSVTIYPMGLFRFAYHISYLQYYWV